MLTHILDTQMIKKLDKEASENLNYIMNTFFVHETLMLSKTSENKFFQEY